MDSIPYSCGRLYACSGLSGPVLSLELFSLGLFFHEAVTNPENESILTFELVPASFTQNSSLPYFGSMLNVFICKMKLGTQTIILAWGYACEQLLEFGIYSSVSLFLATFLACSLFLILAFYRCLFLTTVLALPESRWCRFTQGRVNFKMRLG